MKRLYTFVIVTVIFCSWFNVANAQVVDIPDANLEAALRDLFEAHNVLDPNDPITRQHMEAILGFSATNRQITDLTGLEYATQLEELYLHDNQISDIRPLAGLTQLKVLSLRQNQISNINPLTGLMQLEALSLSNNQVSDMNSLAGLTQLKVLYFSTNKINDIRPLIGLTQLEELTLNRNQISDISPLARLTQLESLAIWDNRISNISPLTGLAQLVQLGLSENQISNLQPLAGLTQLKVLNLANNQIRDVGALAGLTQLERLFLDVNQISDVSPLVGLTQLWELWLDQNNIRDVSPLASLVNLETLTLVGNPITDTSPLADLPKLINVDVPITPPAPDGISRLSTPGQISFSELMFTSKGGPNSLTQWIELYNNSTTETVNLRNWSLTIEARDANGIHRHGVIMLEDLIIPPKQTVLIVTSAGRNSGDFPDDRVYNFFNLHSDAFEQDEHRNRVLGTVGFFLKLSDPHEAVSDVVGNLDGERATEDAPVWELPSGTTEDGHRTSLLRRYDREADAPLDGAASENWHPAAALELVVTRYWGKDTDIGNPGYRGEGALPVELSSFHAQRTDVGIVIHWTTESEFDNAGFNILRSLTKQGPFVRVNTRLIQGAGTTSERNEYKWMDSTAQPNLVYYYQIEDMSFGGDRQVLATQRLKGIFNAKDKFITRWGDLKKRD